MHMIIEIMNRAIWPIALYRMKHCTHRNEILNKLMKEARKTVKSSIGNYRAFPNKIIQNCYLNDIKLEQAITQIQMIQRILNKEESLGKKEIEENMYHKARIKDVESGSPFTTWENDETQIPNDRMSKMIKSNAKILTTYTGKKFKIILQQKQKETKIGDIIKTTNDEITNKKIMIEEMRNITTKTRKQMKLMKNKKSNNIIMVMNPMIIDGKIQQPFNKWKKEEYIEIAEERLLS